MSNQLTQMSEQQQAAPAAITDIFDRKTILGRGRYGTVFLGKWNGEKVAVKRLQLTDLKPDHSREDRAMTELSHPNVLKLITVQQDTEFKYLVLEWCDASVAAYIKQSQIYEGLMPSELNALIQMAEGLAYIHSKNFVHRDIKPENVLISTKLRLLKISDFGLCRPVTETSGSFSGKSGPQGTRIYYAPEFLQLDQIESQAERERIRCNVSIDVFSLGCLFFSYITKGHHLFDGPVETKANKEFYIPPNIIEGKKFLSKGLESNHYAHDIIDGMTKAKPEERWKLDQVLDGLRRI